MEYDELLHCIRAVAEATGEQELYVFGSQSPLMHFGELPGGAGDSREADIMTANNSVSNSYIIDGVFCEDSKFNESFGLSIDGVLSTDIKLAPDWKNRATRYEYAPYEDGNIVFVYIPDVNDIAVAKLIAEREKDRRWLQAMYDADFLDVQFMANIIYAVDIPFEKAQRAETMLGRIIEHDDSPWQQY